MIDAFEARLANLIADRLAGTTEIVAVDRMRDGLSQPTATGPRAALAVVSAEPDMELGDDRQERLGGRGARAERPVVRLAGEVVIRLEVREATNPGQRIALMRGLDRLLLTLQEEDIRTGEAFQTGADLGFALDGGFRLARVTAPPTGTNLSIHRRFDLFYSYSGRFWPVIAPVAGPRIDTIPTRVAVLPMALPTGATARAGVALDLRIPLDLRATSGAPSTLVGRLQGATPPGSLVGATAGLPPGFVRLDVTDGAVLLRYQPPAVVTEPVEVGVELRHDGGGFPILETFTIGVTP
jgi:hypothetical protein